MNSGKSVDIISESKKQSLRAWEMYVAWQCSVNQQGMIADHFLFLLDTLSLLLREAVGLDNCLSTSYGLA